MLRQMLGPRLNAHVQDQDGNLWTEIEAASRRSPDICAAAQAMEATVCDCLVSVFAAETGLPQNEAAQRFSTSAAFILVLFRSAVCLNSAGNVDQSELRSMIIRKIDQTLDDVANSAQKA